MDVTSDGASASTVSDDLSSSTQASASSRLIFQFYRGYQHLLDKWNPHFRYRWFALLVISTVYLTRALFMQRFHGVSYLLGMYVISLLLAFLSPQVEPELQDGPTLPTRNSDEFRPFIRRLPEFKFWYSLTKAFSIALVCTFFGFLDLPVFWPGLLIYWIGLFIFMMRRQIQHMIKYRYVPFSFGKQTYNTKRTPSIERESLLL